MFGVDYTDEHGYVLWVIIFWCLAFTHFLRFLERSRNIVKGELTLTFPCTLRFMCLRLFVNAQWHLTEKLITNTSARIRYVIYGSQCKMKTFPCLKIFGVLRGWQQYLTSTGAFWVLQVTHLWNWGFYICFCNPGYWPSRVNLCFLSCEWMLMKWIWRMD